MPVETRPLPGHVLLERDEAPASILENSVGVDGLSFGVVLAVADDVKDLKPKDRVAYRTHAANGFTVEDHGQLSVGADQVVGVVESL